MANVHFTFIFIRMEYIFATLSTTVTINTVTDYQSPGKAGETLPNSVNPMPRTHMVGVNLWPPPHVPHGVYVCRHWWVHTHTHKNHHNLWATKWVSFKKFQNQKENNAKGHSGNSKLVLSFSGKKGCNMQKAQGPIWSTVGSQPTNQRKHQIQHQLYSCKRK